MIQRTIGWKLEELDRILNDPTAPLEPHRVWSLLDDVSTSGFTDDLGAIARGEPQSGAP